MYLVYQAGMRSLLLSILAATLVTCLSAHTRPNAGAPSPSDSPSDLLDWEAMAPLLHSSGAVAQFGERALQETFRRLARDIPPPALLPQHARSSTDKSSSRAMPPAPAAVWQLPVRRARAGWWFLLDPLARSLAADIARADRGVAIADGVLGEALARDAHGSAERMWARSSPGEDEDGRRSGGGSGGGSGPFTRGAHYSPISAGGVENSSSSGGGGGGSSSKRNDWGRYRGDHVAWEPLWNEGDETKQAASGAASTAVSSTAASLREVVGHLEMLGSLLARHLPPSLYFDSRTAAMLSVYEPGTPKRGGGDERIDPRFEIKEREIGECSCTKLYSCRYEREERPTSRPCLVHAGVPSLPVQSWIPHLKERLHCTHLQSYYTMCVSWRCSAICTRF